MLHNCEDHFHFYSLSVVHIYDLYHVHIISVSSYNRYKLYSLLTCFQWVVIAQLVASWIWIPLELQNFSGFPCNCLSCFTTELQRSLSLAKVMMLQKWLNILKLWIFFLWMSEKRFTQKKDSIEILLRYRHLKFKFLKTKLIFSAGSCVMGFIDFCISSHFKLCNQVIWSFYFMMNFKVYLI